jgi:ubiquinone/menaquinone biosynthesis C-methylase UbiE
MSIGPNDYSKFQKDFYTRETPVMRIENHKQHNSNPKYWDILLGDVKSDPTKWEGKNALDVGCGCGRNLLNLSTLAKWATVDGCDISAPNCEESKMFMWQFAEDTNVDTYPTNGFELDGVPSDKYDFVMSTIVFQHICVHDVRFNILKEVYRVMKSGGTFSFQMAFGVHPPEIQAKYDSKFASYFENVYDARRTNSGYDVQIVNADDLTGDLKKIGFDVINVQITESWENEQHPQWIWIKAVKP